MTLVRIVKDYDWPIMRETSGQTGVWDGIQFTLEPVEECDFLVVLNNRMPTDIQVRCSREHVWAIMQEPYIKGITDWVVEGHKCFAKVFTHHPPSANPKYAVSHPAVPWHVDRTFDELISASIPKKSKKISWITSNLSLLPGHKKRMEFLYFLQNKATFNIDIFGRGIRYIEGKWDGLASYEYSLAIENSSGPDYWTEKVADCFLTWTVPIYYGCTNLEKYFPKESFIRIDIEQPEAGLEKIKEIIKNDDWRERLPALEQARHLVLHHYQLFPHLSGLIQAHSSKEVAKEGIKIPANGARGQWEYSVRYVTKKAVSGEISDLMRLFLSRVKTALGK